MSDPRTPLGNVRFDGFAAIREIGPIGMIALRARPDAGGLAKAIKSVTGTAVPAQRRIVTHADRAAGWMSPDEYLLILPYGETFGAMEVIARDLGGEHHLASVVSDARAVFEVKGARADQVLRKLMPVDFDRLAPSELRRTRAAQVAAAVWAVEGGFRVVCFRSVAAYMMGLLTHSAQEGSELA